MTPRFRVLTSNLLLVLIFLYGVGLVQVYSSSYIFAIDTYGDGLYFFKRQLLFTFISLGLLLCVAHIPSRWLSRWGWLSWFVVSALLLLTLVPGLGVKVGGASRWLPSPLGFRLEPSEFLKIAFCLFFASLFVRKENRLGQFHWIFILAVLFIPLVALLKQPDFGSFVILSLVGFLLLFAFGLRFRAMVALLILAVPALLLLALSQSYRRHRILAFLDPWSNAETKGFQVIQSMLSFQSGGVFGNGIGNSQGKLYFLPEAHTDFTLAIFGEEFGLVGFLILLSLYGFCIFRSFQVVEFTESKFSKALVLGLLSVFGLSIVINCGVVLGLLPTKGLTLPFLSYGGSSLIAMGILFGLILNVERQLDQPVINKTRRRNFHES